MNDRRLAALDRKAVDISSDTEKARELKEFKLIDKRTKIEVDKINKADRLKNRIKALQNRNDEKLEISEYIEEEYIDFEDDIDGTELEINYYSEIYENALKELSDNYTTDINFHEEIYEISDESCEVEDIDIEKSDDINIVYEDDKQIVNCNDTVDKIDTNTDICEDTNSFDELNYTDESINNTENIEATYEICDNSSLEIDNITDNEYSELSEDIDNSLEMEVYEQTHNDEILYEIQVNTINSINELNDIQDAILTNTLIEYELDLIMSEVDNGELDVDNEYSYDDIIYDEEY